MRAKMTSAGLLAIMCLQATATATCPAAAVTYNMSGCTTAGHYAEVDAVSASDCCAQCAQNVSCFGWTFHKRVSGASMGRCDLSETPRMKAGVANATCGCRLAGCNAKPAPSCVPVARPQASARVPLPTGVSTPPHLISILVDGSL